MHLFSILQDLYCYSVSDTGICSYVIFIVNINLQESFFPVNVLEKFCEGTMLYSPFLSPDVSIPVISTFPPSLNSVIFPAVVFCDPKLLAGALATGGENELLEHIIEEILAGVLSSPEEHNYVEIASRVKGERKMHGGSWSDFVTSLCLAMSALQPCQLKSLTSHVSCYIDYCMYCA